jgi:hypothetical protein
MHSGVSLSATVMELQYPKVVMQICIIAPQGVNRVIDLVGLELESRKFSSTLKWRILGDPDRAINFR